MRKKLKEESIMFISVLKWVILATAVGGIVGTSTAFFLFLLNGSTDFVRQYQYYFYLLPVVFFFSSLIIRTFAPEAEGHGTEKVIEAVHKRSGKIDIAAVPVKLIATVLTIAMGGSAGKEGPAAQIGAGLASAFAGLLRLDNHDRKKLVICGLSAGFASIFGTPIAGAIFGIEVLFVGSVLYEVLLPSFIAGIAAHQVSLAWGVKYFSFPLNFIPPFSGAFFLKVLISGLFFGLCSFLLIEVLRLGKKYSGKLKIWPPLKGLIGGAVLTALTMIFSTNYLGLGIDTIENALEGGKIVWYAFFMKMLFTSITLNFGGSGGIITPIFFIGATAGATFANMMGLDVPIFVAIGLTSLLAGAANTPIAASIMSIEMFGPAIAPYAAVAGIISFLMTGHRSVYPSQVLSVVKSASIQAEVGREMHLIEAKFSERKKSVTGIIARAAQWTKSKLG
jgi:H+/Cl- antiporter ClcA